MKRKNGTLHSQGIFVVLFILFPSFLEAQGNSKITLYDEAGVPFRVRSNGDPKGPKEGASRLTLDSLENGRYTLLIEYPDTSIPKLEKSLELPENVGFTYSLQAIEGEEKRDWNLVSRIRTLGEKESDTTDRQRGRVPGSDGAEIPETDSAFIHSYKGKSACSNPVGEARFERVHQKVKEAIFQKERIRIARDWISRHCVLSSHVAALMKTLDYEENRLDLAKYAYGQTFDQKNYTRVRKALNFKRSKSELDRYLNELR